MKNIITAIALSVATATTASANICNVNPNAIIDYPGYHGIQKSWYDKGEYLFMFSAVSHHADPISYKTWNNVESIVTHYRLDKATCTMSEIEVVITENKERFEAPVVEEVIVDEEEILNGKYVTKTKFWGDPNSPNGVKVGDFRKVITEKVYDNGVLIRHRTVTKHWDGNDSATTMKIVDNHLTKTSFRIRANGKEKLKGYTTENNRTKAGEGNWVDTKPKGFGPNKNGTPMK